MFISMNDCSQQDEHQNDDCVRTETWHGGIDFCQKCVLKQ
jgi:hypothetical protein